MKTLLLALAAAAFAGSAAAGDADYAAKVYYRLDFGGSARHAQSVGFRLDNTLAEARGAPAAFQLSLDTAGSSIMLHGVELRGSALAAGATGNAFFDALTPWEWAAVGGTIVVVVLLLGGSGGGDNAVAGTGGV